MKRAKVILYIAQSIDGYIAADDGGVDFLSCVEEDGEDYGYFDFYKSVDAVIMGANTYEQILGFGDFPYPDKPCFVFTSKEYKVHDHVTFVKDEPHKWFENQKHENSNRYWLVGGSALVKTFHDLGLIDAFIISIVPTMLGFGIPLFQAHKTSEIYTMKDVKSYPSGLVQIVYERKSGD